MAAAVAPAPPASAAAELVAVLVADGRRLRAAGPVRLVMRQHRASHGKPGQVPADARAAQPVARGRREDRAGRPTRPARADSPGAQPSRAGVSPAGGRPGVARRGAVAQALRRAATARRRPADVVRLSPLRGAALAAVPSRRPGRIPGRGGQARARARRARMRGAAAATVRRIAAGPVPGRTHQLARELTGHGLTARDQRLRQVTPAVPTGAGGLRIGRPAGQAEDGTPAARATMTSPGTGGAAAVRRRGRTGTSGRATGELAAVRTLRHAAIARRATGTVAQDPVQGPGSVSAAGPGQIGRRAGGHGPGQRAVPPGTEPTGAGPPELAGLPEVAGLPELAGLPEVAGPPGRAVAAGTGSALAGRGLAGRGRLGPGRPGKPCRACQITSPPISWTLKPVLN